MRRRDGDVDLVVMGKCLRCMPEGLRDHVFIPVCIVNRYLSAIAKYATIVHNFRVETSRWPQMKLLMDAVVQILIDEMIELYLASLPNHALRPACPHWFEARFVIDDANGDEIRRTLANQNASMVIFSEAIPAPNLEHMMHDALDQLGTKWCSCNKSMPKISHFAKFIWNRYYRDEVIHSLDSKVVTGGLIVFDLFLLRSNPHETSIGRSL